MTPLECKNEIAKKLACNYYNVSLRKSADPTLNELKVDVLKRVFSNVKEVTDDTINELYSNKRFNNFSFSRNVLIVGSGAAKGELPFCSTGNEAISKIEAKLKLDDLLNSNKETQESRYRTLASHYFKTVYNKNSKIENIKKELGFEGRLSLLLNYYDKQDVLTKIKETLDYKYLFCHFYDIVAHLFKHRFIDVVINFNFDELLDNAIEEEIGPSGMFHKIVDDSDCRPIEEYMEMERLRVPIYIKPHGTISSKTSLLFTKEHYIDMSEDMKILLHDIFMGKVNSKDNGHNDINILVAGFKMESIELNNILFSLQRHDVRKNVTYYFFTSSPKTEINKFKENFRNWADNNNEDEAQEPACLKIPCMGSDSEEIPPLSKHFSDIHDCIKRKFNKPFSPIGLTIHEAIFRLFPKDELNAIGELFLNDNYKKYRDYLKHRFIFHLLYELIKWKGKVARNVLINERAGKYFKEYKYFLKSDKSEYKNDSIRELEKMPDIISFISENLGILMKPDIDSPDNIFECETLFKDSEHIYNDISEIVEILIYNSPVKGTITQSSKTELISFFIEKVYDSKIFEVSPLYNDVRHSRFRHFDKEQILPTTLNLTYKFFEYAILREWFDPADSWDELYFASESGKPIFNLHRYCDRGTESYLSEFVKKTPVKKVKLLFSDDKEISVDQEDLRDLKDIKNARQELVNNLLAHFLRDNLMCKKLKGSDNIHHIALFLRNGTPVYGFYFFRPEAKNRINPVCFESGFDNPNSNNNSKNLDTLKELFLKLFNEKATIFSPEKLKTHV
jgi:hypothetical protein